MVELISYATTIIPGFTIDRTYMDMWTSFSAFFQQSNVSILLGFGKVESTFKTEFDSGLKTGIKKVRVKTSDFSTSDVWFWIYDLINTSYHNIDHITKVASTC